MFDNYMNGSSTPEELETFMKFVDDPVNKELLEEIMEAYLRNTTFSRALDADQKSAILNEIFLHTGDQQLIPAPKVKRLVPLVRRWAVAATVLVTLAIGIYFAVKQRASPKVLYSRYSGEIAPGSNKATLTLADGRQLSLTDAANGKLAEQAGVKISKLSDGQLVYQLQNQEQTGTKVIYNTISTPAGGQYRVILPDGTEVWLNAESQLTYPVSFNHLSERRVEFTGEGYFVVAKVTGKTGAMPFIVKTKTQEVRVLGTHFNINSYPDEAFIATTLLEGSVKVKQEGLPEELLVPGQQARVNKQFQVLNVDTNATVAWKNGLFKFDNASIYTVMNQFSRWYDVDVAYEGKVPSNKFTGEVYRNMTADKALKVLSFARIRFRTEVPHDPGKRKRIIITK